MVISNPITSQVLCNGHTYNVCMKLKLEHMKIINEKEFFFTVANTDTETDFHTSITGHHEHGVIAKVP